jgi:hypothetical protein
MEDTTTRLHWPALNHYDRAKVREFRPIVGLFT